MDHLMAVQRADLVHAPPPGGGLPSEARFWRNSVGLKAAMSVSGMILALFLLEHVVGNVLIYAGRATINGFAATLESPFLVWLVWIVRVLLAVAFVIHAASGITLYLQRRRARPVPYHHRHNVQASVASRTMIWSGLVILAYVIYHLLHLTFGVAHPDWHGLRDTYDNVVLGLRVAGSAAAYLIAMLALGFHLWHGLYAMLPSVGWRERRYIGGVRSAAALVGTLLALAFASIPVAVVTGLVG
jgi:succinate dehydrogenase cytochrome b subunit